MRNLLGKGSCFLIILVFFSGCSLACPKPVSTDIACDVSRQAIKSLRYQLKECNDAA